MKLLVAIVASVVFSSIALCQTRTSPESEIRRVMQSDGYEGSDEKIIDRMGDRAALAITKVVGSKDLTADDINRILLIIHTSFAAPEIIEIESDRQPRTTLSVLKYLDSLPVSPELKIKIADTRKFVEQSAEAKSVVNQPLAELSRELPEIGGLAPARDADELDSILHRVGERVQAFFRDFPNTSSVERIRQERLRGKDKVLHGVDQKFRYLCSEPTTSDSGVGFDEYREAVDPSRTAGDRDLLRTKGFASAPLFFHPLRQPESTFRYLGRQAVDGRETFVVAFAERPQTARIFGGFTANGKFFRTLAQGLAWIDAQTYQIVRMRTDLLAPLPVIRLEKITTQIDFSEVHFKQVRAAVWLPSEVTVTVDWNGRLLRNRHSYSDFMLFTVQTKEKQHAPKPQADPSDDSP